MGSSTKERKTMTKAEFARLINENGPIILDGATGTNLMEAGMPIGVCPEQWVMEHPEVLLKMQREYVEAGSHIVYAPTFTGNRIKLEEYGLQDRLVEINTTLVKLSKQAVDGKALVAGDMTMTGQQLFPMGELMFEELVDVYKEQAGDGDGSAREDDGRVFDGSAHCKAKCRTSGTGR